jgi:hypothetical protein
LAVGTLACTGTSATGTCRWPLRRYIDKLAEEVVAILRYRWGTEVCCVKHRHGRGGAGGRESVWLVCAQVVQRTNSGSHYGHMPIMPLPQVGAPRGVRHRALRAVRLHAARRHAMPAMPPIAPSAGAALSVYDCRDAIRSAHEMPRPQWLRQSAAVIVEGVID